jgi:hypothetical protein
MKDVKLIRLINGDELIAEVLEHNAIVLKIKQPLRVLIVPSQQNPNQPSVAFAPWAEFSSDKEMDLASSAVLAVMTPIPEFDKQYRNSFSAIKLQTPQLLVPQK